MIIPSHSPTSAASPTAPHAPHGALGSKTPTFATKHEYRQARRREIYILRHVAHGILNNDIGKRRAAIRSEAAAAVAAKRHTNRAEAKRIISQAKAAASDVKERVTVCGNMVIYANGNTSADVMHRSSAAGGAGGKAYFRNLAVCDNYHCPVCAARRGERLRLVLQMVLEEAAGQGYGFGMATFTFSHQRGDKLTQLLEVLTGALKTMKQQRRYREFNEEFGVCGGVDVLEITHGDNGFHPHKHRLLFFDYIEAEAAAHRAAAAAKRAAAANFDDTSAQRAATEAEERHQRAAAQLRAIPLAALVRRYDVLVAAAAATEAAAAKRAAAAANVDDTSAQRAAKRAEEAAKRAAARAQRAAAAIVSHEAAAEETPPAPTSSSQALDMKDQLWDLWWRELDKRGAGATYEHGVDVVLASAAEAKMFDYIAKFGKKPAAHEEEEAAPGGIAAEVAKANTKRSRAATYKTKTMLEVLDAVHRHQQLADRRRRAGGEAEAAAHEEEAARSAAIWLEYFRSVKGKNIVVGLSNICKMLGLNLAELESRADDMLIAAAATEEEEKIIGFSGEEVRDINSRGALVDVLEAVEAAPDLLTRRAAALAIAYPNPEAAAAAAHQRHTIHAAAAQQAAAAAAQHANEAAAAAVLVATLEAAARSATRDYELAAKRAAGARRSVIFAGDLNLVMSLEAEAREHKARSRAAAEEAAAYCDYWLEYATSAETFQRAAEEAAEAAAHWKAISTGDFHQWD